MPMDVRDRPARYGDGSGLVEHPPKGTPAYRRWKREQERREAEAAAAEARVKEYEERQRKDAVQSCFARVFGAE